MELVPKKLYAKKEEIALHAEAYPEWLELSAPF